MIIIYWLQYIRKQFHDSDEAVIVLKCLVAPTPTPLWLTLFILCSYILIAHISTPPIWTNRCSISLLTRPTQHFARYYYRPIYGDQVDFYCSKWAWKISIHVRIYCIKIPLHFAYRRYVERKIMYFWCFQVFKAAIPANAMQRTSGPMPFVWTPIISKSVGGWDEPHL